MTKTIYPTEFKSLELTPVRPKEWKELSSLLKPAADFEGFKTIDYMRAGQIRGRWPLDVAPYTVQKASKRLVLWCVEGVSDDAHSSMLGLKVCGTSDKYVDNGNLVRYEGEEVTVSWMEAWMAVERGWVIGMDEGVHVVRIPMCKGCGSFTGPLKKCGKCKGVPGLCTSRSASLRGCEEAVWGAAAKSPTFLVVAAWGTGFR